MEDVLEVYTRPYDPLRPVVCMDETSKQLLRDTRQSLPMEPARVQRVAYEYERGGVAGTPTFYINGVRHDDSYDLPVLLTALQRAASLGA